jgi:uncharacterized Zn-finger protein
MVKYETNTLYACPYCNTRYNTWEEAYECATEDQDIESPNEVEIEVFVCEYCDAKYDKENDAKECEDKHIKNDDIFAGRFGLKIAANHPDQTKLSLGVGKYDRS